MAALTYYPPLDGTHLFINPIAFGGSGIRGVSLVNQCKAGNLVVQTDDGRQQICAPLVEQNIPIQNTLTLQAWIDTPQATGQLEVVVYDSPIDYSTNQLAELAGGGGGATLIPIVNLAAWPPSAPQDGQVSYLNLPATYDPLGGKELRWLCVYDAALAMWQVAGPPLHNRIETVEAGQAASAGVGKVSLNGAVITTGQEYAEGAGQPGGSTPYIEGGAVVMEKEYSGLTATNYKLQYGASVYADLATVGPQLTLPRAGDYLVRYGARIIYPGGSSGANNQFGQRFLTMQPLRII